MRNDLSLSRRDFVKAAGAVGLTAMASRSVSAAESRQVTHWISQLNLNDVWHSVDGVNWVELPDALWIPRHAASVFVFDDALWMVAGNNMESDVWKLIR